MEAPQPNQTDNDTRQIGTESSKKPISEKVSSLLNLFKKARTENNPDQAFSLLASLPDENVSLPQEQQELLNQANNIKEALARVGDILKAFKDNELAAGAVIAGIGLISTLALGGEGQLLVEVATIGAGSIGGSGKEALKNVAVGTAGILGSQGIESLAGQSVDNVIDVVSGFADSGKSVAKDFSKEVINTTGRKAIEFGRNRMMKLPSKA